MASTWLASADDRLLPQQYREEFFRRAEVDSVEDVRCALRRLQVHEDCSGPSVLGREDEVAGGVDHTGSPYRQEEVTRIDSRIAGTVGIWRQHLFEEYDIGSQDGPAPFTVGDFSLVEIPVLEGLQSASGIRAAGVAQSAVQFDHAGTPCPLMQAVDVLSHYRQGLCGGQLVLKGGDSLMGRIGFGRLRSSSHEADESPDAQGIGPQSGRGRAGFGIELLPETAMSTERVESGSGGDARSREDYNTLVCSDIDSVSHRGRSYTLQRVGVNNTILADQDLDS